MLKTILVALMSALLANNSGGQFDRQIQSGESGRTDWYPAKVDRRKRQRSFEASI
jgi:hypothetical protein